MKNALLLTILFVAFNNSGIAQALSVEKIWKNYEFRSEGIEGFRSMQDGIHFTRLNEKNGEQFISKHEITNSNGLIFSALKNVSPHIRSSTTQQTRLQSVFVTHKQVGILFS